MLLAYCILKNLFADFGVKQRMADRERSTVVIFIEKEPLLVLALGLVVGLDLFKEFVRFGVAVGWGFPDDREEDHTNDAQSDGYLEDRVPAELVGKGSEDETGDGGAGVAEDAGHSVG